MCLIDCPLFPNKVSSKCPAIIFAVKRTASVPGRIRLLIISVITLNGFNMIGVPYGIKCSNIIIFIYCNWVVTRWQWLFYIYTKHEIGYC